MFGAVIRCSPGRYGEADASWRVDGANRERAELDRVAMDEVADLAIPERPVVVCPGFASGRVAVGVGQAGPDERSLGVLHLRWNAGELSVELGEQLRFDIEAGKLVGDTGGQRPHPSALVTAGQAVAEQVPKPL